MRTALTIAGSDSGGGAGIQADLLTFAAHGVFGLSAITAVTAQSSERIVRVYALPADMVAAEIDAVIEDFGTDTVKIGMLATSDIASAVADALVRHRLSHVVLDTVLGSTSGTPLLDAPGIEVLRSRLFPLADVMTVNLAEARVFTGMDVRTVADAHAAARELLRQGARSVIVKGGHLDGPPVDVFHDGRVVEELRAARIDTRHTHGTGCTFASAIAARLALGESVIAAARLAKGYVTGAIAHAPGLGRGQGPLAHFWRDRLD
jgi:hydroxymethylpyrimidine/phosphomethylpyrimidine kinase